MAGPKGISNSRGSQFVRGACLTRINGVDPTGPAIDTPSDTDYLVGFTSGIPASYASSSNTRSPFNGGAAAVSGFTIPAQGFYRAKAIVHMSGLTAGVDLGVAQQEYAIKLNLNSIILPQSVRVFPVASGIPGNTAAANPAARPVVSVETECFFEANGGDTLAVAVRSSRGVGTWRLVGADTILAGRLHALPGAAAILIVERLPTTPLDSSTSLS